MKKADKKRRRPTVDGKRVNEGYDPRVTLRMKGEVQTTMNVPIALRDSFKAMCKRLGLPMKMRVSALMAADVEAGPLEPMKGGRPVSMKYDLDPGGGYGCGSGLSIDGGVLTSFRALCAAHGWPMKQRLSELLAADVRAKGLRLE